MHLWQRGPSMSTNSAKTGPAGPVVAGDHLHRDRTQPGPYSLQTRKKLLPDIIKFSVQL